MPQTEKLNQQCEFIFGGSFDPIHFGHLNIIKTIQTQFPNILMRLIPCAIPALKDNTAATFEQRVKMLKLAIENLTHIVIDKRESFRNGLSYTLDSLMELAAEQPDKKWLLVVGADSVNSMAQWHQWQQLADYCHLVIIKRPGSEIVEIDSLLQQLGFSCAKNRQELVKKASGRYYCLNCEEMDISSSSIRSNLKEGLSIDRLIPSHVIDFIKNKAIY